MGEDVEYIIYVYLSIFKRIRVKGDVEKVLFLLILIKN